MSPKSRLRENAPAHKHKAARVARHFAISEDGRGGCRTFQKFGLARNGYGVHVFQFIMGNDEQCIIGKRHKHAAMQKEPPFK